MRNLWISHPDSDGRESCPDLTDPVARGKGGERLGDGFIKRLRCHIQRMRSVVQIVDNDRAGLGRH